MTLSNLHGDKLQLWISAYQFPDPDGYYLDLNWLSINVIWQRAEAVWQASDPCLTTEELSDLLDWFKLGEKANESIEFMEPCLKFSWLTENDIPRLRVYLQHELNPEKTINLPRILQSVTRMTNASNDDSSFWLEFPISAVNISTLVSDLEAMVDQFPVRHERT